MAETDSRPAVFEAPPAPETSTVALTEVPPHRFEQARRAEPNRRASNVHRGEESDSRHSAGRRRALLILAVLLIICVFGALVFLNVNFAPVRERLGPLLGIMVALVLAALPVLIGFTQTTLKKRQIDKLQSAADAPISQSTHYKVALRAVERVRPIDLDGHYSVPLLSFAFLVLVSWLFVFLAPYAPEIFAVPNYFLGGMAVIGKSGDGVATFQMGTFSVMEAALAGSYIYVLSSLIQRINNNDIYPISFYFFSVRIILAIIVAAVFRQMLQDFPGALTIAAVVGFVIGLMPDQFVIVMIKRAADVIKIRGDQPDPDPAAEPNNLHLMTLKGLSREQSDRLKELGIENAEILSCQNPFLIWTRTPYDLSLIINWIAQAQLVVLVREAVLKALRDNGVNDIFGLHTALNDANATGQLAKLLAIDAALLAPVTKSIAQNPIFVRLDDLRGKL